MNDVHQRQDGDMQAKSLLDDRVTPADDVRLRSGAYSLLAAMLRVAPDQAMLNRLTDFSRPGAVGDDDMATAIRMLGVAATDTRAQAVDEEYHDLFIGLGRGELVPYGSWYLTGFLMEEPLSTLRVDLQRLGFVRNDDVKEPEDHVAALCEVMAMMVNDGATHQSQDAFFGSHLRPWVARFFSDLEHADKACFYRSVARFGAAFFNLENKYFAMQL